MKGNHLNSVREKVPVVRAVTIPSMSFALSDTEHVYPPALFGRMKRVVQFLSG